MNVRINLKLDVNKSLVDDLKSSENDFNHRVLFQIEEQIASELYHSLRKLAEIYRLLSIVSDSDISELIKLVDDLFDRQVKHLKELEKETFCRRFYIQSGRNRK